MQKPVWETQTQERRYTVQKPVWETQTREERTTVMKPVYETVIEDRSYDVTRDVVETATREEQYTVMKPVYETAMQQQVQVVRKPVYETSEREQAYTVTEPVTQMRTAYSVGSQPVDTVTPVVTPGATGLGYAPGGWVVDPYTGLAVWQRGGYQWVMTPGAVVNQVNRVYQPTYTPVQVPETTYVNRVVTQKVPVQTVRYVDEQVVTQVPVQTMKMVAETAVRQVPVQTVRKVVERVDNKVPVQVCKMVPEEQVRQVAFQVCKMVAEEKVEPVQVQVMKVVTEERSVQVPRVVEKKTPYTYTVRMPRTVVTKVPLDPCGNPLPGRRPGDGSPCDDPRSAGGCHLRSGARASSLIGPPRNAPDRRSAQDVQRQAGRSGRSCQRGLDGVAPASRRSGEDRRRAVPRCREAGGGFRPGRRGDSFPVRRCALRDRSCRADPDGRTGRPRGRAGPAGSRSSRCARCEDLGRWLHEADSHARPHNLIGAAS